MRARLTILAVAVVICAGLLWFILHTRAATADVEARLMAARGTLAKRNAALLQMEKTAVPKPRPVAAALPAEPAPASATTASPAPRPRPPSLMDYGRDNPQLMNLWIANKRSELQQRYGVLFQNLNLTPAQREKFKDVLAAETARGADIGAAATERGLTFADPVIKKLADDSHKQTETDLVALLGTEGFRGYQEFERSVRVRGFVDGFAVQTATSDPLTPQQGEQLVRALLAASPAYQHGGEADPTSIDWDAVDRSVREFMSPAQWAAWKLGVAHNPYGGSRVDLELKKVYDAAKAKPPATTPSG